MTEREEAYQNVMAKVMGIKIDMAMKAVENDPNDILQAMRRGLLEKRLKEIRGGKKGKFTPKI